MNSSPRQRTPATTSRPCAIGGRDAESGRPAMMPRLARYLPVLEWGRAYGSTALTNDLVAAGIVTIMLIPHSLAYAMLAGLPTAVGLYASILPLIAYARSAGRRLGQGWGKTCRSEGLAVHL